MNFPAALLAFRCLVWDTFRQALSSGVFWLMLGVTVLCTVLCLSVRVTGDVPARPGGEIVSRQEQLAGVAAAVDAVCLGSTPATGGFPVPAPLFTPAAQRCLRGLREGAPLARGELSLWFDAVTLPVERDREDTVRWLESQLAGWVVDGAGLLLALVWTAGFLPSFLEAGSVAVVLAKPLPRWWLLTGKFLGVLVFVAFQAALFVGATWAALGLAAGAWEPTYLLSVPMLLLHFTIFFSFSALLAVCTRSTVACVFGSVVFWLVCWGMNFGRHVYLSVPELHALGGSLGWMVEAGYWALPKPADLGILFFDALHADNDFSTALGIKAVREQGAFHPLLSVLSSLLFALAVLAVSAHDFVEADY
jgi:hypothetical protein